MLKVFHGVLGLTALAAFALAGMTTLQAALGGDVEARDTGIAMAIIIGGIVLSSWIAPKAPVGPVTGRRRDLELPEYVLNWRWYRWPLVVVGMIMSALFGTEILLGITLAAFVLWDASVSRRLHDENRHDWEIAFHSEEDGFCDGDGDGDGGGD